MARDVIMEIYHYLGSSDIFEYLYLGTSEKLTGLKNIRRAYEQAALVALMKKKSVLKLNVVRFGSLGSFRLLHAIGDTEVLDRYYKQYLAPLLEYDKLHHTSYFALLQVLIDHDFNVAETAVKLYMHRNTANYKIGKIREILRCDLTNLLDRSNIVEAYKIWCILYKKEDIPDRRKRKPTFTLVARASGERLDEMEMVPEFCVNLEQETGWDKPDSRKIQERIHS